MTLLSSRIPVSGYGARVPVRVEDVETGRVVALLTAARDGRYAVEVPAGRYRVAERWARTFVVDVPGSGSFDVDAMSAGGAVRVVSPTREAPAVTDMARSIARHRASKRRREG